jgi:hypothetical protein
MAFVRERAAWEASGINEPGQVRLTSSAPQATYKVDLEQHLGAIGDGAMLHASVLIHSYALV